MAITSLDILNLSHSLKDICEVNCNTPECLSQTLKLLMQYNLIQANLEFGRQFGPPCIPTVCPPAQVLSAPPVPSPAPNPDSPPQRPPVRRRRPSLPSGWSPARLDIGDPFLADYEK